MGSTIPARHRKPLPGDSDPHHRSNVAAAIEADDYRAANALLRDGGHLPALSKEKAKRLAHRSMDNGTWPHLLAAVLHGCHVDPNSQHRPSGMTLLGKSILHNDKRSTQALLRDDRCDLYCRVRSKPTPAACLVVAPDKSLRDAVMATKAGQRLRPCDKQAVARKTVPLSAAQLAVLGAARRKGKSLAPPRFATLDSMVRQVNPKYGAQIADLVRNYVRTKAPLIINFPLNIIPLLDKDPFLRNQFETGTSHGLLEPKLGGGRDGWEARMFDGGYHAGSSHKLNAKERPRYGSVSIDKSKRGVNGYGGGVFELADHVRSRVTIAHDDSCRIQSFHLGTLAYADHVLCLLGKDRMHHCIAAARGDHSMRPEFSKYYVEMQVHGRISLLEDIKKVRIRRASVRPLLPAEKSLSKDKLEEQGHVSPAQVKGLLALGKKYHVRVAWRGTYRSHANSASLTNALALMETYQWPLNSWHRDGNVDQFMFTPSAALRKNGRVVPRDYHYAVHACHQNDLERELKKLGAKGLRVVGHHYAGNHQHQFITRKRVNSHGDVPLHYVFSQHPETELADINRRGYQACAYSHSGKSSFMVAYRRAEGHATAKHNRFVSFSTKCFDNAASDAKATNERVLAASGSKAAGRYTFILESHA